MSKICVCLLAHTREMTFFVCCTAQPDPAIYNGSTECLSACMLPTCICGLHPSTSQIQLPYHKPMTIANMGQGQSQEEWLGLDRRTGNQPDAQSPVNESPSKHSSGQPATGVRSHGQRSNSQPKTPPPGNISSGPRSKSRSKTPASSNQSRRQQSADPGDEQIERSPSGEPTSPRDYFASSESESEGVTIRTILVLNFARRDVGCVRSVTSTRRPITR